MKSNSLTQKVRITYFNIPKGIRTFLINIILVTIAWQVAYIFFLQPKRIIDRPLTKITAISTAHAFSWISPYHATSVNSPERSAVLVNGKEVIGVEDGCNGLELFVLYLGFLICMPTNKKNFFLFAVVGTLAIYVLNIAREVTLVYLYMHNTYVGDIAHHYVFKVIVYGGIFYTWILYSKKQALK